MLVDYYRADYVVSGVSVEYYFLFVREALSGVLPEVSLLLMYVCYCSAINLYGRLTVGSLCFEWSNLLVS